MSCHLNMACGLQLPQKTESQTPYRHQCAQQQLSPMAVSQSFRATQARRMKACKGQPWLWHLTPREPGLWRTSPSLGGCLHATAPVRWPRASNKRMRSLPHQGTSVSVSSRSGSKLLADPSMRWCREAGLHGPLAVRHCAGCTSFLSSAAAAQHHPAVDA